MARPRLLAVVAVLGAALVGMIALAVAARDDRVDSVFSDGAIQQGFTNQIPSGQMLCSGPLPRLVTFDLLRFSLAAKAVSPNRDTHPALSVVLRRGGPHGAPIAPAVRARLAPEAPNRDRADARVGRIGTGGAMDVCIANRGRHAVALWGGIASPRRAGLSHLGPTVQPYSPQLQFVREPEPSRLDQVPTMLRRAALFRPTWMGAWTFWVLGLGVVLLVPGLLALALAAALRRPRARHSALSPEQRFARFRAEVEPGLLSVVRVHRFGRPPLIGDRELHPAALETGVVGVGRSPAEILRETGVDHVLLLEAGDELAPGAERRFGEAVALDGEDVAVLTCDHDRLDEHGERRGPRVFPGPSPDLALECDLAGAALCVRREAALASIERDGPLEERAWRYDLLLRLAGADGAGHAHVPAMLVHRRAGGGPTSDPDAALRAAQAAVRRRGEPEARVEAVAPSRRRVRRPVAGEPSVEAIVPFRDRPELLRRCASSLLERSTYPRLSLRLVDNGSIEPETAELLAELARHPAVEVMPAPGHFNFAALNNAAVAESRADFVVLLNNDTEVISPDWVQGLLEHAQRPEVGAVAPLLVFPDGSVQHAGAAIGLHDYAGHPFAGLAPDQATPFGAATDGTRNWLAVTAACLMVERAKLEAVGGLDERFVVAGNDVDLGLRLTAAGHRSLCVAHVRLLHDESRTRGSHVEAGDYRRSEDRYGSFRTVGDPFYNPALTLRETTCALRVGAE